MTTHSAPPEISSSTSMAAVQRLADAELSLPSRLGHLVLLLAALIMTAIVGSLWVTEPSLPRRAQLGFAIMTVIGSSWVAFALWVLTHRRVLFARHSIVAGRLAVTFTSVFVLGALAVGYTAGGAAPYAAAATGVVMLTAAVILLRRAHRTFARLTERRQLLERQLGKGVR